MKRSELLEILNKSKENVTQSNEFQESYKREINSLKEKEKTTPHDAIIVSTSIALSYVDLFILEVLEKVLVDEPEDS